MKNNLECLCCNELINPGTLCNKCESDDCQDCCDHSDKTFYCCLICGKDLTENRISNAYDQFKNIE